MFTTGYTRLYFTKKYFIFFSKSWRISPSAVRTDTASNTYVRAPGSTQGHAAMEMMMEHLAHKLEMDPLEFRMINMIGGDKDHPIRDIVEKLRKSSNYDVRMAQIKDFNKVSIILILLYCYKNFTATRTIYG